MSFTLNKHPPQTTCAANEPDKAVIDDSHIKPNIEQNWHVAIYLHVKLEMYVDIQNNNNTIASNVNILKYAEFANACFFSTN